MSSEELRANTHRFRVQRASSSRATGDRRRSASPDTVGSTTVSFDVGPGGPGQSHAETGSPDRQILGSRARGPGTVPSCDRCRTFKKKCSRTFPSCSLCAGAGQKCSLATRVASGAVETRRMQARIEWLSDLVNRKITLPDGKLIETVDTGADITLPMSPSLQRFNAAESAGGHGSTSKDRHSLAAILDSESLSSETVTSPYLSGKIDAPVLIIQPAIAISFAPEEFARRCVDAYFRHVNRAYPFIDKAKVYRNLQAIADWSILKTPKDYDVMLLHLVMAIGCTTLQRAGKLPRGSSSAFEIAYSDIVQECLSRNDNESLQILVLVALYSLFDPQGMSAWTIAGLASRQAILTGLSRKVPENNSWSTAEIEHRHRLFWSIWVLDRMMAFSLGLPVALTDEKHDVPLPGLTIDEFASDDRQLFASMLQTNRQVILLRQLEDRILRQVLFRTAADVVGMSYVDCRSLVQTIRADIENWYSNGCLVSSGLDADSLPIHNSIGWLSTRYYHLLLFLHYPCPLNSKGSSMPPKELLPLVQKCLQLTSVLLQQKQLPLNRVTLCRILPVGLLLMHCFAQTGVAESTLSARDDIGIIINVLEAFPQEWHEACRAAKIFRQALDVISLAGVMAERYYPSVVAPTGSLYPPAYSSMRGAPAHAQPSLLHSSIESLGVLMEDVLGPSSCYIFHELPTTESWSQVPSSGPRGSFNLDATMPPVSTTNGNMTETSTVGNNWELLDLTFF